VKRYLIAFGFLLLVTGLMLLATLGVSDFADNMFEDVKDVHMHPRGEEIKL